jgi:hypothetical protein
MSSTVPSSCASSLLLAVTTLDCLTLPVRHSMQRSLLAGALRDGQQWLWVPCDSVPSACLLCDLHRPGAMLRINCKLAVHDSAFCKQQTMKGAQANTLPAAAHLLVGVGEAKNATYAADDVAERMLTYLIFDCWIILDDVCKMVSKLTCVNNLGTATFLRSVFFNCSASLAFGDTMTWGWSLKAATNNDQIASSILEYPFLRLASVQKMPILPADSYRRLS